jgi:hypothetical protein
MNVDMSMMPRVAWDGVRAKGLTSSWVNCGMFETEAPQSGRLAVAGGAVPKPSPGDLRIHVGALGSMMT